MNNMRTLPILITLILPLLYTPMYSIRNSLNIYHEDGQYNPEIVIYQDDNPKMYKMEDMDDMDEMDEIRSIHKYDPNNYDNDHENDNENDIELNSYDHDTIQDSNLVAPPKFAPLDSNDNEESEDDDVFTDDPPDKDYSHWFKTESYYISILNFCIIGLVIVFVACMIYWLYKCGGFRKCPCKCCDVTNNNNMDNDYGYGKHSKHKKNMDIHSMGMDISDGEDYMSHHDNDDENDGTVHTPLLGGTENEFKYQSFDLLSDV